MGISQKKSNMIFIVSSFVIFIITIVVWLFVFSVHRVSKKNENNSSEVQSEFELTKPTETNITEEFNITKEVMENEYNLQEYFTDIIAYFTKTQPMTQYYITYNATNDAQSITDFSYRFDGDPIGIKELRNYLKHLTDIKGFINIVTGIKEDNGMCKKKFSLNPEFFRSIAMYTKLAISIKRIVFERIKTVDDNSIFITQGFISLFAIRIAVINPGGHFFKIGASMNYEELKKYLQSTYSDTEALNAAVIAMVLRQQNLVAYYSFVVYIFMLKYGLLNVSLKESEKMKAFFGENEVWKQVDDLLYKTCKVYEKYRSYIEETKEKKMAEIIKNAPEVVEQIGVANKKMGEIIESVKHFLEE